jgi:hypothetical protein
VPWRSSTGRCSSLAPHSSQNLAVSRLSRPHVAQQRPTATVYPFLHPDRIARQPLHRAPLDGNGAVGSVYSEVAPLDRPGEFCSTSYLKPPCRWAHGYLPQFARCMSDTQDLVQDTIAQVLRRLVFLQPDEPPVASCLRSCDIASPILVAHVRARAIQRLHPKKVARVIDGAGEPAGDPRRAAHWLCGCGSAAWTAAPAAWPDARHTIPTRSESAHLAFHLTDGRDASNQRSRRSSPAPAPLSAAPRPSDWRWRCPIDSRSLV